MSLSELTVTVFYYDPKYVSSNRPQEVARRCSREVFLLGEQLLIISEQLGKSLRQKDIEDVITLCQFHYENMLFRVYALRERTWDVLAALSSNSREPTGNAKFRNRVEAEVREDYPELSETFQTLLNVIESIIRLRNIATHETILELGLMEENSDEVQLWEFNSFLEAYDPESTNCLRMHKLVRQLIKKFVEEQQKHVRDILKSARDFSHQCDAVILQKCW